MKEITRIHIAKTPYEIETAAKKQLETYLRALEEYNIEAEIIEDIEVRMTEILLERGVKKGAVIAVADVSALKKQLGAPEDFMADGDIAVGPDEHQADAEAARKLYRDTEGAVLGGVLAGIAAFFKVNPIWVRLVFILLALASFGTMLLVYIVLWVAVPPARTAADKLQMAGRPVTARAIREMNKHAAGRPVAAGANARQTLLLLLGIGCVLGAALAAAVTLAALFGGIVFRHNAFSSAGGGFLLAAFVLALVSGVLLTVLFILGAYASFVRKLTGRIIISICVVITLGLLAFGTAAGLAQYGSLRDIQVIRENTRETKVMLPGDAVKANAAVISSDLVRVHYIATQNTPSAKLRATVWQASDMPKVDMELDGAVLKINAKQSTAGCGSPWGCDLPVLTVYGPALESLAAKDGSVVEYEAAHQPRLTVAASGGAQLDMTAGAVETLAVKAGRDSAVSVDRATVQHLDVSLEPSADVLAGTVRTLAVTHPGACPARAEEAILNITGITEGKMTINGKQQPAQSFSTQCVAVDVVGREETE